MTDEQMIERLQDIRKNYTGEDDEALMWAIECIRHVPKQGEWIEILRHYTGACSICGKVAEITNFCPNCGASMSANDRQVTGKLNEEPKDSHAEYWNSIGEWKEGE